MTAVVLSSPVTGMSRANRASDGTEYSTEKRLFSASDILSDRMASSVRRNAIAREMRLVKIFDSKYIQILSDVQ